MRIYGVGVLDGSGVSVGAEVFEGTGVKLGVAVGAGVSAGYLTVMETTKVAPNICPSASIIRQCDVYVPGD